MKINLGIRKAVTILSLAAFCFASSPVLAVGVAPMSLAQMYSLAADGNVRALRAAVQRGLNIDSVDRFGNTGLCHSISQDNYIAYNAFRSAGANANSPCIQNIPTAQYDRFMAQSRVAPTTDNSRQAYNKFNRGEFVASKTTWIVGGLLLAGGIAALAFGGGGGGGKSSPTPYTEPDDSLAKYVGTKAPDEPETRPYQAVKFLAEDGQTVINQKQGSNNNNFAISNNSSIKVKKPDGTDETKKLVDIIDLNGNILDNTAYLQVAMKARNGSTVINGNAVDGPNVPLITLGDATAGLVADDRSFAINYGSIKTVAQNGTVSMIAGNHSTATNHGEINMAFKGIKDTDSVIGMYADTYSSIVNNGNITGNTIDVSTTTGDGGADAGATTANSGTIIGMEVRTVNEVSNPDTITPSTASNNGTITLNAQSDSAAISSSLVGMGGYLDKAFLDGTKLIRRASSLYLNNTGTITLNYTLSGTGTYVSNTNTLLGGTGGVIGMRADAKTTAVNDGTINLLMTSGVKNAGAGMQSVHGGSITNNSDINITGGEGSYGMLSVRGKGNNAEIDSLAPLLLNNGNIHVISTNGFGMASYNGGRVTNAGNIRMDNVGTGMRTNTGILDNQGDITLNNSGQGMVIKSGDASTDTTTGGGTGGTGGGTGGTGGDTGGTGGGTGGTGGGTGDAGTPPRQDLSKAEANNNGLISINNADNAQGIFIEDGKAVNNGTGIKITNTSVVPATSSYGIKAEKGTVDNNSLIDMNVLVSTDGTTSVDSYGIFSDSANINNNVTGSIVFRKRGTGIASTSGRIMNNGTITMEQGGTGISSGSGNVYNNGSIIIVDNATAVSTGIVSQAGIITNNGSIKITGGNGATGIKAGLLVNNNSDIDLTGRNITGIELTGADAIANNNADINIISTGLSSPDKFSYGIKAGSSIVNATVKNYNNINLTGTTDLTNKEKGYGISIADGTAYNYGNITFNNMYGWGMSTSAGTLINDGNITMNSGGFGMFGNGVESQITNSATGAITITVPKDDDKSDSYGMFADGGATAINKGLISISTNINPTSMLSKAYGIYVQEGNATNQGKIKIVGSNSTGMAYTGSTDTDTIQNFAGGTIDLDGENLIGMSSTFGTAINSGIINVGTDLNASTAPKSIGMQSLGGIVINQAIVNVNSANSVGLQSDSDTGVIRNNGVINMSDAAIGSYAFLSNAGVAVNGLLGTVNSNLSNTDLMRATAGSIINQGKLDIKDALSNVNAMHVVGTGSASNDAGGVINVGMSTGATGTNNAGIFVDGEGTASNKGTINVYSQNSYGMKSANTNSVLTNDGVINVMGSATGSIALYSENGSVTNSVTGIINMYVSGKAMQADHGSITNHGTITLTQANSEGMYVSDNGTAENTGTLNINGANSNAMRVSGRGTLINSGTLNINGANSNAMMADDASQATLSNSGIININAGATGAYAIYNKKGTSTNETSGTINVLESGVTAMFTEAGTLTNKGVVNLRADNSTAISVIGNGGTATNDTGASILVNNTGSKAMYANGASSITNNGTITLKASNTYGMYAENSGIATNNSNIFIDDALTNVYAMYAKNGGKIINGGNIKLGSAGGVAMYAENGSADNRGGIEITSGSASSAGIKSSYTTGGGTIGNSGSINVKYVGSANDTVMTGIEVDNTSSATVTVNNSGTIEAIGGTGKAYGILASGLTNITNTNSIKASGLVANGIFLNGTGTINNNGEIDVNSTGPGTDTTSGIWSTGASTITNGASGIIKVASQGNAYGIYLGDAGRVINQGSISVDNGGIGVYMKNGTFQNNGGSISVTSSAFAGSKGISTENTGTGGGDISNSGTITVNYTGSTSRQQSYGIYAKSSKTINITNSGVISVGTSGTFGEAFGIYAEGPVNMTNAAGAQINVSGDMARGMYLKGTGTATNHGNITINDTVGADASYGMYTEGGRLVNSATGTINITSTDGQAVGMYATGAGASIVNQGNIIINGVSITTGFPGDSSSTTPGTGGCTAAGCGKFIQVSNGATFTNNATVSSTFALDFDAMRADDSSQILLGKGGTFEAPEISGKVRAAADIVVEGNEREYTNKDSFVGEDEGIVLDSGSYLFDAVLKKNADGNQDVVMTMKEFTDVVDNNSVADFLDQNYDLGNNLDMYGILKSAGTASSFTTSVAEQMGLNLIPSFAKQNMDIVKAVNRHMSSTLFNNNQAQDVRATIDYVYDSRQQNGVNMLSGYQDEANSVYALFDRKHNNNFRYGFGVSITSYNSSYDNGSSRDEIITQILAPLIYTDQGLKIISMPRLGFGWGEYERKASGVAYKADTKNYYYGITNEIRKEFAAGPIMLEPTAEFNVLGLYQDQTKEKQNLEVNSANNVSVEGGLGLYAKKAFTIREEDDFNIRLGGSWYHEFNNPYQAAKARIAGMAGSYQMDSYDTERNRAILTYRMDYKYDEFDFFFEANKYLEEDSGYALSAGLGYKF